MGRSAFTHVVCPNLRASPHGGQASLGCGLGLALVGRWTGQRQSASTATLPRPSVASEAAAKLLGRTSQQTRGLGAQLPAGLSLFTLCFAPSALSYRK